MYMDQNDLTQYLNRTLHPENTAFYPHTWHKIFKRTNLLLVEDQNINFDRSLIRSEYSLFDYSG